MRQYNGWIGVDLDGTLARYTSGFGLATIGQPIPEMVDKVKQQLALGNDVRIFTARVASYFQCVAEWHDPNSKEFEVWLRRVEFARQEYLHQLAIINDWCLMVFGMTLPVTCIKDYNMIVCWDDRAIQVIPNTGKFVE